MINTKKEWESAALTYSKPHIRKEFIRKPAIVKSLGNIRGKKILDLGCGDGYYSRILTNLGAKVIGVDFSKQSILLANKIEEKNKLGIKYYYSDINHMPFLKNEEFDFVIGDMVFVTIATQTKYIKCIKEVYRVLKPSGVVLISKGHPGNFFRPNHSKHYSLKYDRKISYFESLSPQKIEITINGKKATWTNYHRTIEDFLNPWLKRGFFVTEILEPRPLFKYVKKFPEQLNETRDIPIFVIFKLKKMDLRQRIKN